MGENFAIKFSIILLFFFNTVALGTTLKETVVTALETDPTIGVDEATAKANDYLIDAARAGYLPSLDIAAASVGYQRFKLNEKLDRPLSFPLKGQVTHFVSNPTVVLSQTIFDGFATPFAVERATEQARAAYATLGQTREQGAFNAVSAYLNLRAQQRLLIVAEEAIKKHQEILDKVKKRVTGGISTIADVYQVESRLDEAYAVKEKTEGELEAAFADFIAAVGFRPEDELETPCLPNDPISAGLECVLTRVSQHSPAVLVALANLKIAKAELDQTISPFLPTIRAQLISNAPVYNVSGITAKQSAYTAQLVLDYNLFSGGKDYATLKSQQQQVLAAIKRVDVAKRATAKTSRTAWATYLSNEAQVQELMKTVEVNKKLYRAYELQFELVSRTLFELLDAYVSYYRSKNDLINAEAGRDNNHALLLAVMGELIASIAPAECGCLETAEVCPNQGEYAEVEELIFPSKTADKIESVDAKAAAAVEKELIPTETGDLIASIVAKENAPIKKSGAAPEARQSKEDIPTKESIDVIDTMDLPKTQPDAAEKAIVREDLGTAEDTDAEESEYLFSE